MGNLNSLLQILSLMHCFWMVSTMIVLQPGFHHIKSGSDVSMIWKLTRPIINTTIKIMKDGGSTSVAIKRNITTGEFYLESTDNKFSLDKINIAPVNSSLNVTIRRVVLNDSQTFEIRNIKFTLDVYEPPVLRRVTFRKNMLNFLITSTPQDNTTWSLNDRPLGNVNVVRKGSASYYTVKYPQGYLCSSYVKFRSTVFDSQLVRKVYLPNDLTISNIDITVNRSCYTVDWFVTSTNCLYTSIQLYTSLDSDLHFNLQISESSFQYCLDYPIGTFSAYLRPVFGNLNNGTWVKATHQQHLSCIEVIKSTQYPNFLHVVVGVGSVVTIVLFFCCLSHCILVQKRKDAMKAVALKVNGVRLTLEKEKAISNPLLNNDTGKVTENTIDEVMPEHVEENKQEEILESTTKVEDDNCCDDGDKTDTPKTDDDVKITFTLTSSGDDVYNCQDEDLLIPVTSNDNIDDVDANDVAGMNHQPLDVSQVLSDESLMKMSDDKPLIENEQCVNATNDVTLDIIENNESDKIVGENIKDGGSEN